MRFQGGFLLVLLVLQVACGGPGHSARPKPTTGAITGMVRDTKSGEYIALAEIVADGRRTTSDQAGIYLIDRLAPGRYTLNAKFAGQPITINKIEVVPGMASYVDISFTLGDATPLIVDWGDPREGEIRHFTTRLPRIEGTVGDAGSRERIAGAVVTAMRGGDTLQTVTDDHGRYRFDHVMPGTYAISAYYSIGGRGQIELRRSEVTVEHSDGVFVPLWLELAK